MPMIDDISKAPTRKLHLAEGRRDLDQVPTGLCVAELGYHDKGWRPCDRGRCKAQRWEAGSATARSSGWHHSASEFDPLRWEGGWRATPLMASCDRLRDFVKAIDEEACNWAQGAVFERYGASRDVPAR